MKEQRYRRFGVMLDVSRNAVMKVSEIKFLIDCLQKMGYNFLELYMEDTYEIQGEPYFGYLRGRYTAAEIKEIDAYAKKNGIELIPCVQTLAHFPCLVNHPVYADIVDINEILLIDEPKTYALIDRIFATLADNFTSRLVNIGMDEAHMVGLGNYLKKHGLKDRYELLIRHLGKVAEIAKKYGFQVHMWSDMFYRLATGGEYYAKDLPKFNEKIRKSLPENVELVYWDYYNSEEEYYDKMLDSHAQFGCNIWFAGGAWTWQGFAPLNWFTRQTMQPAMRSVLKKGIKDVFITMWGDNGAECSVYSVLPSLYAIRQYAEGNFDEESISKGFYKTFKMRYEDFLLLDLPNRTERKLVDGENNEIPQNPCKSLLYNDLFLGRFDKLVSEERPIPYAQYAEQLKAAAKRVGRFDYIFHSMSKLCSVLAVKAELGVKTRRAYQAGDKRALSALLKEYKELEKRLVAFHEAFCTLWHKENKGQGWEVQDARIGGLIQRTKTCSARLKKYISGKIDKIEELEEEILPYGPEYYYSLNNYSTNITMNYV